MRKILVVVKIMFFSTRVQRSRFPRSRDFSAKLGPVGLYCCLDLMAKDIQVIQNTDDCLDSLLSIL